MGLRSVVIAYVRNNRPRIGLMILSSVIDPGHSRSEFDMSILPLLAIEIWRPPGRAPSWAPPRVNYLWAPTGQMAPSTTPLGDLSPPTEVGAKSDGDSGRRSKWRTPESSGRACGLAPQSSWTSTWVLAQV